MERMERRETKKETNMNGLEGVKQQLRDREELEWSLEGQLSLEGISEEREAEIRQRLNWLSEECRGLRRSLGIMEALEHSEKIARSINFASY